MQWVSDETGTRTCETAVCHLIHGKLKADMPKYTV